MRSTLAVPLLILLALTVTCPAQILINEVHGYGQGAAPSLPGDYIEIWNQTGSAYDLAGHTVRIFPSDQGFLASTVIPSNPGCNGGLGSSLIPANGFWIFQEGVAFLGQPLSGTLANLNGMRGMPATWSSSSSFGCVLLDPSGNCIDYIYVRRGTTAAPASPPHIVAPCTWVLGNVSPSGSDRGHAQRLTNTNTSSYTDWADSVTTTVGTPGAVNTILGATQTPTGPVGPLGNFSTFELNDPACSFDVNGGTNNGDAPIMVVTCLNTPVSANLASTNVGNPWDVVLSELHAVAPHSACGPGDGGVLTPNGQKVNINFADPNLYYLNGFIFGNAFPGSFQIPVASNNLIPLVTGQMVILDASNPDLYALSAATELSVNNFERRIITLTDDSTANVDLTSLCGGSAPITFYGTTYTSFWVNSNGRIMFGSNGDISSVVILADTIHDRPAVGFWTDLNPASPGSGPVTVSNEGGMITAAWNGTYYFGTNVPVVFSVVFDPASGDVTLNYPSIPASPTGFGGIDAQILGISGGVTHGATIGANIQFVTGVPGIGALPTDILVDFWDGFSATAPGGVNRVASAGTSAGVRFSPAGPTYTYLGL